MQYSKKVIQHFQHPLNQGQIKDADAIGQVGNPVCGDVMKIYLKVSRRQIADDRQQKNLNNCIIKDIKFETLGCAAAIAVSSALTQKVKGKSLSYASKVNKDDIVKDLGGLPIIKVHCSMLGIDALRQAINKYLIKK